MASVSICGARTQFIFGKFNDFPDQVRNKQLKCCRLPLQNAMPQFLRAPTRSVRCAIAAAPTALLYLEISRALKPREILERVQSLHEYCATTYSYQQIRQVHCRETHHEDPLSANVG